MSVNETMPKVASVTCDTHECQSVLVPPSDMLAWHSEFREWLDNRGWSLWAGRGRRTYCPVHGPKPGHKMRAVRP